MAGNHFDFRSRNDLRVITREAKFLVIQYDDISCVLGEIGRDGGVEIDCLDLQWFLSLYLHGPTYV